MFTRVPLVLASLVAATAIAAACEPPFPPLLPFDELPPRKPAPTIVPFPQVGTVVALNGREETIEYTVVVPVLVRETVRTNPIRVTDDGGKTWEPVWKTTTVYRWEHKLITRKSKLDRLKFFDATGKPVATLDAWKRLEIGTKFFVSADGAMVSADYLKLIGKDVLVVVDFDNVLMERIFEQLPVPIVDRDFDKPRREPAPPSWPILPRTGPLPEPRD
jgi:hypothetical protein